MTNSDMAEYWNRRPADVWVTEAERFDSMLAPFGRRLLAAAVSSRASGSWTLGAATEPSAWTPPEPWGPAGG
jgi:hypothetical protein